MSSNKFLELACFSPSGLAAKKMNLKVSENVRLSKNKLSLWLSDPGDETI